jgi:hypothetical protein
MPREIDAAAMRRAPRAVELLRGPRAREPAVEELVELERLTAPRAPVEVLASVLALEPDPALVGGRGLERRRAMGTGIADRLAPPLVAIPRAAELRERGSRLVDLDAQGLQLGARVRIAHACDGCVDPLAGGGEIQTRELGLETRGPPSAAARACAWRTRSASANALAPASRESRRCRARPRRRSSSRA